jgi:hypothetical protein
MSEREKRAARNEAISREINEGIEEAHRSAESPGYVRMVCECTRLECTALIVISISEYEAVRTDPRHFAVLNDHVAPDVEMVVRQNERFAVVKKREGDAAEVAVEADPRS